MICPICKTAQLVIQNNNYYCPSCKIYVYPNKQDFTDKLAHQTFQPPTHATSSPLQNSASTSKDIVFPMSSTDSGEKPIFGTFNRKELILAVILIIFIYGFFSKYVFGTLGEIGLLLFLIAPLLLVIYFLIVGIAFFLTYKVYKNVRISLYAMTLLPLLFLIMIGIGKIMLNNLGLYNLSPSVVVADPFHWIRTYLLYLFLYWLVYKLFFSRGNTRAKDPNTKLNSEIKKSSLSKMSKLINKRIDSILSAVFILVVLVCWGIIWGIGQYQDSKTPSLSITPSSTLSNNSNIPVEHKQLMANVQLLQEASNSSDIGQVVTSPDGNHFAYSQVNIYKNLESLTVDGKVIENTNQVEQLVYSSDSQHLAYVVDSTGGQSVFVDGVSQGTYPDIYDLTLSPDGKHVAFDVQTSINGNYAHFVVLDGVKGATYNYVQGLTFSPTGNHFAYIANKGNESFIVLDGVPQKVYPSIVGPANGEMGIVFSPDGSKVAYKVGNLVSSYLVINTNEIKSYQQVDYPQFSPDGEHFAFFGTNTNGTFLVLDGKKGKDFPGLGRWIVFSPDSKSFAYAICGIGQCSVSVNEQSVKTSNGDAYNFTFSPDSKHYAYTFTDYHNSGKSTLIVDNQQIPLDYAVQKLIFSPDSHNLLILEEKPFAITSDHLEVLNLENNAYTLYSSVQEYQLPSTKSPAPEYNYMPPFPFTPDSNSLTFTEFKKTDQGPTKVKLSW